MTRPLRLPAGSSRLLLAVALVLGSGGCASEPSDSEPDRVVAELIDRLQRVHGDRKNARLAYDLLWSEARSNLAERAKRASDVAGRELAPEEMLAPSRFSLRHKPRRFETRTDGDWAEVSIHTEDRTQPPSVVKCVREDGHWRVVLEIPPLPPIQRRPETEP